MQQISSFLVCGENVWWTQTEDMSGYKFFDSDRDEDNRSAGPSTFQYPYYSRCFQVTYWVMESHDSIILPAPFIRLYDHDGNLTTTRSYPCQSSQSSQSSVSVEKNSAAPLLETEKSGNTSSQDLLQSISSAPDQSGTTCSYFLIWTDVQCNISTKQNTTHWYPTPQ